MSAAPRPAAVTKGALRLCRNSLIALLLPFSGGAALAKDASQPWAVDPDSQCAVFNATLKPDETVHWSGACKDGRAEGPGTATFSGPPGVIESFTGEFAGGMAADGAVTVSWGQGWRYDGEMLNGRFDGEGILVNDKGDQFAGWWKDGKLNGAGRVIHADGARYEGRWKDDQPSGRGVLIRTDGSRTEGEFQDGQLAMLSATLQTGPLPKSAAPSGALAQLAGKRLLAVDGAALALTQIEGGLQRDVSSPNGARQTTILTFINERLGTVAADGDAGVTGLFRLTGTGVEIRYADGHSEILAANGEGVVLKLETPGASASCRSFYPEGHSFSDAEKKAALAEYASRLGLPAAAAQPDCSAEIAVSAAPASRPQTAAPVRLTAKPARAGEKVAALAPVTVRQSAVHAIDPLPSVAAEVVTAARTSASPQDVSQCLHVESDGTHWGFRNGCAFDVQFDYCLARGGDGLTGCDAGGVRGSVAKESFGALLADKSFSEADAEHHFRWLACRGGAGEVVAHLDRADPPEGRCLRARDLAMEDTETAGNRK